MWKRNKIPYSFPWKQAEGRWHSGVPPAISTMPFVLSVSVWFLLVLMVAVTAMSGCRVSSMATPATEEWWPAYLHLQVLTGVARIQQPDTGSTWMVIENGDRVIVSTSLRVIADEIQGVNFTLGDGSVLTADPGSVLEMQNPRTLPYLSITLWEGSLSFRTQKPSYEFQVPTCALTFLNIPAHLEINTHNGDIVSISVIEGAVLCRTDTEEEYTIPTCQKAVFGAQGDAADAADERPHLTQICTPVSMPPNPATPTSTSTPWWSEPTDMLTPTVTPTVSPTPTSPRVIFAPTFTPTPLPPTPTPAPPPTSKPRPKPTNTSVPPTPKPPPTDTPPPPPPPTDTPPPLPTDTPPRPTLPPPPTNTPEVRPTPDSGRSHALHRMGSRGRIGRCLKVEE